MESARAFHDLDAGQAAGIFIANLHLLIVNLLPRTSNWNGTPFRTDGGQLLDPLGLALIRFPFFIEILKSLFRWEMKDDGTSPTRRTLAAQTSNGKHTTVFLVLRRL